ncbi:MAG TPA: hypothetical protein VII12_17095 [Thermoanaerobaculia bacterium]
MTIAAGIVMSSDSRAYSDWADVLLRLRFNYEGYFRSESVRALHAFRIGFITLVALLKMFWGDGWRVALVVINHLATASAGVLLVGIVRHVTGLRIAAWLSLGWYLASYDVASWNRYVLGDSTFLFLSFGVFFFAARALLTENRAISSWICAVVLLLIAISYRPTGFVVAVPLICSAFFKWRLGRGHSVSVVRTLAAFALVSVMVFGAVSWIAQDPGRWPFTLMSKQARLLSVKSAAGEVVEQRPETYHRPPRRFDQYIGLYMDRLAHFFQVTASGFSSAHNAYQLAFFVPLYAGAVAAVLSMGTKPRVCRREIVVLLSLLAILSFAVFHAFTILDFDWRYRLPVVPHLILLASAGVALVKQRLGRPAEIN